MEFVANLSVCCMSPSRGAFLPYRVRYKVENRAVDCKLGLFIKNGAINFKDSVFQMHANRARHDASRYNLRSN